MQTPSICRTGGRTLARLASAALIAAVSAAAASAHPLVIPPVAYPALAASGASARDFTPAGWRVESQVVGDLNQDGIPDLALVLRERSRRNVLDNSGGLGADSLDTNPRILVVALGRPGGGYGLALANHGLIPRTTDPVLDDYLSEGGGIALRRGTLRVTLHLFASAGGWGMGSVAYAFRFQDGRFELVGYDSRIVQRNSGEIDQLSIDYLTGRLKRSAGHADTDFDKVSWTILPSRPLMTLSQIGDGMAFDPEHPTP